jgi:hypothetical protein
MSVSYQDRGVTGRLQFQAGCRLLPSRFAATIPCGQVWLDKTEVKQMHERGELTAEAVTGTTTGFARLA